MNRLAFLVASSLVLVACKSSDPERGDRPKPREPAATPADAAEPSPAELVAKLTACAGHTECEALATRLGKIGATVVPELVKIAVDWERSFDQRGAAAAALAELRAPGTGMTLFEAATVDSYVDRERLYRAAGASGDDAVFAAATTQMMVEKWDDRGGFPAAEASVTRALLPFGKRATVWAAAEIEKTKDPSKLVRYGWVIRYTATTAELAMLAEVLARLRDQTARGELAVAVIRLGRLEAFDVLLAGLTSKAPVEREHAVRQLRQVIDKLPAEHMDAFRAAAKRGAELDRSKGYVPWREILDELRDP